MANVGCIWDLEKDPDGNVQHIADHGVTVEEAEEEAMNDRQRKTIEWTPQQRAQHKAIRDAFPDWHPGPEELIASGAALWSWEFAGGFSATRMKRPSGKHSWKIAKASWLVANSTWTIRL